MRRAPSNEQMTWYQDRREAFIRSRGSTPPKPRAPTPPPQVPVSRRPSFSSDDSTATSVEALSDVEVPDFSGLDNEAGITEQTTVEIKTADDPPVEKAKSEPLWNVVFTHVQAEAPEIQDTDDQVLPLRRN